jgi:hypothetical protein
MFVINFESLCNGCPGRLKSFKTGIAGKYLNHFIVYLHDIGTQFKDNKTFYFTTGNK